MATAALAMVMGLADSTARTSGPQSPRRRSERLALTLPGDGSPVEILTRGSNCVEGQGSCAESRARLQLLNLPRSARIEP